MTAIETLRATPIPEQMAHLPLDPRGYPIFWSITADDGSYDFQHTQYTRMVQSGEYRLCGICGKVMRGDVVFIGGPLSCENRTFSDPPMHPACARYAWNVCPYITRTGWAREPEHFTALANPEGSVEKPGKMGLYTCRHSIFRRNRHGYPLFRAYPAISIEWREEARHGQEDPEDQHPQPVS